MADINNVFEVNEPGYVRQEDKTFTEESMHENILGM